MANPNEFKKLSDEVEQALKEEAELKTELGTLEKKEKGAESRLKIVIIVLAIAFIGGTTAALYFRAHLSKSSKVVLEDKEKISLLDKKIVELEGSAPNPVTGARITLKPEELESIVNLICAFDKNTASLATGVVWDKTGIINTNKHVITDQSGNVRPDVICAVGITSDASVAPKFKYLAQVLQYSTNEDVARLQIRLDIHGKQIPSDTTYSTIKEGSSSPEKLPTGSYVAVAGYPAIGGNTLTVTEGVVSGRFEGFIKTDTKIDAGNSGGAALNFRREYIGIPTFSARLIEGTESLFYFIPIDTVNEIKDWVNVKQ